MISAVPDCIRCVIYTRISKDVLGDGHGIANQLPARARYSPLAVTDGGG